MVLDRRMFRRPSQIAPNKGPSSRGVGITSGLAQPVQKFAKGDFVGKFREAREEILADPSLREAFPKSDSFYERAGMSPFQFFAALGSPMQPGQTVLGKIGEAGQYLDIKPIKDPLEDFATEVGLTAAAKTLEDEDRYKAQDPLGQLEQDFQAGEISSEDYGIRKKQILELDQYAATGTDDTPSSIREVNAYIETLSDPNVINKATGLPWTPEEITKERSLRLSQALNSKTVLSGDEQIRVLETTKDLELRNEIAEGLIGDIRTKGNSANSRMNSIKQAQILLPEATTGIASDFRNFPAYLLDAFPALKTVIPEATVQTVYDALGTGSVASTEVLNSISAKGTLDVLAFSDLGAQISNKEIDLLKENIAQTMFTKEGQQLLYDLESASLQIYSRSQELLDEFFTQGTVNGEAYKTSAEAVAKIKQLENEAARNLMENDALKERINEVTGFANPQSSEFFANAGNAVFEGQTVDLTEAYELGRIKFHGYSDENGSFTSPSGQTKIYLPRQPMYTVTFPKGDGFQTIVTTGFDLKGSVQ
jgi:hypothetical protein